MSAAKFGERGESHRVAGAEYGGVRRRVDALSLRIQGKDIDREKALGDLEGVANELTDLAKRSRALSDWIYGKLSATVRSSVSVTRFPDRAGPLREDRHGGCLGRGWVTRCRLLLRVPGRARAQIHGHGRVSPDNSRASIRSGSAPDPRRGAATRSGSRTNRPRRARTYESSS
jgi:hypothetical protein